MAPLTEPLVKQGYASLTNAPCAFGPAEPQEIDRTYF